MIEERKREYSVVLPLDVAERLQYSIQTNPYIETVDLMDELNYAIRHKIENKYLIEN